MPRTPVPEGLSAKAFHRCKQIRSSPRVHAGLRGKGKQVNHKRVVRLMRRHHIAGVHLRRCRRTTIADKTAAPAPDLIGRAFTADRPDAKWCGDITYLRVGHSWMYLATVIDLFSRRVIGYSMAEHMRAELVRLAKLRWRIEHDYRELKTKLGLDHFEGRTWQGWHHHVTPVSAAHAFYALQKLHPKTHAPE